MMSNIFFYLSNYLHQWIDYNNKMYGIKLDFFNFIVALKKRIV